MAAEIIDGLVKTLSKTEIRLPVKNASLRRLRWISVMSFTEDTLRVMELTVN